MASTEKFNNVMNYVQTGANLLSQGAAIATQIKAARDAAKTGQAITTTATPTATTTTTTANVASNSAANSSTTSSNSSTAASGTGITLGINNQTLIIGGIVVAGIIAFAMMMRKRG